ncbi:MAG: LuxR C-terminal-related transcriptional regulator [Pseudomonas proteolytica]|uniref:LuxR C-terminal-related transcriptional regulator n=1 Tax=Pseudomonas proteolytica TaxID=219574 RepID=UPI003F3125BE
MSSLIRVGVLDEQEVVRHGLRAHLAGESGIEVSGTYGLASSALRAVEQGSINLLLMDHRQEDSHRKELIKTLKSRHPELRLLAFLTDRCPATEALLLNLGVHGVVSKTEPLDVCVQAIRLLAAGRSYLGAGMAMAASGKAGGAPLEIEDAGEAMISHPSLSQRERDVLRLCIRGLTVTRIAAIFERSLKTVSTQKQSAYRKLGLKSDMDLFRTLSRYRD